MNQSDNRVILDTDTWSEVMRALSRTLHARATAYHRVHGRYTVTVITVAEAIRGLLRLDRNDRRRQLASRLRKTDALPLDVKSAELGGQVAAELEGRGQQIGWADPLIAAIAIHNDLPLVTGNTAHFARVQALGYPLRLENWRV